MYVHVCMYVCMHVCMYVCMHVCVYVHVQGVCVSMHCRLLVSVSANDYLVSITVFMLAYSNSLKLVDLSMMHSPLTQLCHRYFDKNCPTLEVVI